VRPRHVLHERVTIVRPSCREERLDVLVGDEIDEEVQVVLASTADGDVHAEPSAASARRAART
jgi:hypothetical protein